MVLTTINAPTQAVVELATRSNDWPLIVIGDNKTPLEWHVDGATFMSIDAQRASIGILAQSLPENHYCRKNLGYLTAISRGATVIGETDDDNYPGGWPHTKPIDNLEARILSTDGWANVYQYFTDDRIWPRGLPLSEIQQKHPEWDELSYANRKIGVHQFLAAGDPDVDAIYRLTVGRDDHTFLDRSIILDKGTAVPFNSQCTIWFEEAFPLMYLPSNVSFRMTDIWRSFVAQVCLWAMDSHVAYHGRGVYQERNEHDLHRDFMQEVIGYERNDEIFSSLLKLELSPDAAKAGDNLRACYQALREIGIVDDAELELVDAWLRDLDEIKRGQKL